MEEDYLCALQNQKEWFQTGKTIPVDYRCAQLKRLKRIIRGNHKSILKALAEDLGKPSTESYTSEIAVILNEIDFALSNIKKWVQPRNHCVSIINYPAQSYHYPHPYGTVLIIGPWNYPFGLLMRPLVNAISAGNCSILKPSEFAPSTANSIEKILALEFNPGLLKVIQGDASVSTALIQKGVDYIFFTGGTRTGRLVMMEAADHLTPVTLELGGKNPCIIDSECNLQMAARRIVWGKFFNAGQSCISPDYCLIPRHRSADFEIALISEVNRMYGHDPQRNPHYGRIANDTLFDRLQTLTNEGKTVIGGICKKNDRYIAPTILSDINWSSAIMQEEIFGPVLPIIKYDGIDEILEHFYSMPSPLAVYCFSDNSAFQSRIMQSTRSGSICFNGTIHLMMAKGLPFGGVGESGTGRYQGKAGFDQFSYTRSVMRKSSRFEFTGIYPPYKVPLKLLSLLRRFLF
jgi:aldehyde dehydrogenase (NAD+)